MNHHCPLMLCLRVVSFLRRASAWLRWIEYSLGLVLRIELWLASQLFLFFAKEVQQKGLNPNRLPFILSDIANLRYQELLTMNKNSFFFQYLRSRQQCNLSLTTTTCCQECSNSVFVKFSRSHYGFFFDRRKYVLCWAEWDCGCTSARHTTLACVARWTW